MRLGEVPFTSICDANAGLTEGHEMLKGVKIKSFPYIYHNV